MAKNRFKLTFRYYESSYIALVGIIFIALFALMSLLTKGGLLRPDSLQSIAFQIPLLGILSLAQMGPMLTGGIDLAIISTASLSGLISGMILTGSKSSYSVIPAILAGMGLSLGVGAMNGFLIAIASIPAIMATLGMMIFIEGVGLVISKGATIAGFPKSFLYIGGGTLLGIPMPFLIFLGCMALMILLLNKTRWGLNVYMLGSNRIATLFSGVNNRSVEFRTYLLTGFFVGAASQVMAARFNAAQASYGESYLLQTVLACVLGGVSPSGGFGKVIGLFGAVAVLQIVATGFNLMRLSLHLATALWGIILLFVIVINRLFFTART